MELEKEVNDINLFKEFKKVSKNSKRITKRSWVLSSYALLSTLLILVFTISDDYFKEKYSTVRFILLLVVIVAASSLKDFLMKKFDEKTTNEGNTLKEMESEDSLALKKIIENNDLNNEYVKNELVKNSKQDDSSRLTLSLMLLFFFLAYFVIDFKENNVLRYVYQGLLFFSYITTLNLRRIIGNNSDVHSTKHTYFRSIIVNHIIKVDVVMSDEKYNNRKDNLLRHGKVILRDDDYELNEDNKRIKL